MNKANKHPSLYICATPIGNLQDITLRVLETLNDVDIIACEDTRVSGKLLKHYQLKKEMIAYHEHNKHQTGQLLIEKMKSGQKVALISDAGMPGINDPGSELISLCQQEGILYSVLPGPSAFITALIYSGIDSSAFSFLGFFPKSSKDKNKVFETLNDAEWTTIFYETPHRITKTMAWLSEHWPDREVALIREISKIYEEMIKGTADEVFRITQERQLKGEMVLIIGKMVAKKNDEFDDSALETIFQKLQMDGLSKKEAVNQMAMQTGIRKNELYQRFAR